MAMVELRNPSLNEATGATYVDLTDGTSGRKPLDMLAGLPGAKDNAILATNVDSLTLNYAVPVQQEFDLITYEDAQHLTDRKAFENNVRIHQISVAAEGCIVLRFGSNKSPRYFKVFVRNTNHHKQGNPAFSSDFSTLEFEELVQHRVIWPIGVDLKGNSLRVLNPVTQSRNIRKDDEQLLFTLRPETFGVELGEGPSFTQRFSMPAAAFYNNPFPIARVVFKSMRNIGYRTALKIVEPKWIEHVEITANFSPSFVNSTYLLHLNKAGRPFKPEPEESLKFSVFLVDRTISIEEWDPTVVVEPQDR